MAVIRTKFAVCNSYLILWACYGSKLTHHPIFNILGGKDVANDAAYADAKSECARLHNTIGVIQNSLFCLQLMPVLATLQFGRCTLNETALPVVPCRNEMALIPQ